jgi:phage/plasmid-associated DNA primase
MITKLAKGCYEKDVNCSMKPVIKGTDHAIWQRAKLIPFTRKITEDRWDILSRDYASKSPAF